MSDNQISPISNAAADHYIWGSNCDGWHLLKTPGLSVIQECMPPGTTEVRHFHHYAQQFFYILSGKATMEASGTPISLTAGQGLWIPAGTPHQMRNDSGYDLLFLVISQPPSHGDRELATENRTL